MPRAKLVTEPALWDGEMRGYRLDGHKVLLLKLEGQLFAYEDRCAHLGLPLSDGTLDGSVITCRAHHYKYCARSGRGVNPASVQLKPLQLVVEDGVISVELSAGAGTR
jgi:nitrite reductase/ring-hydroxylating ferredoxin subunit